jgi:hypothetical protein
VTRKTSRPTDEVTRAALTQQLPKLSIPEQIELFEKTICDLEIVIAKSTIAIEGCRGAAEELTKAVASAKQTIADIQHAIASLSAVGG